MQKKIKLFLILPAFSIVLTSCSDVPLNSGDFTSRISFNLWDFLATFLAFVVLVVVAFFFGYKPVKEFIQKRKDYIDGNIHEAEEREEKTRLIVDEANKKLADSKKEAVLTIKKAEDDALKVKEEIIKQAKDEAISLKANAEKEIAQEIEAQKDEIHQEIVSVALNASSKILEREVSEEDNRRLIDNFVKDLNKDNK